MDVLYSPFDRFNAEWSNLDAVLEFEPEQEYLVNEQKCELLIAILKNPQVTTESILENFAGREFYVANPYLDEAVEQRNSERITSLFPCLPRRKEKSLTELMASYDEHCTGYRGDLGRISNFTETKMMQSLSECVAGLDVNVPEGRKKILAVAKVNAKEKTCQLSTPHELGLDLQKEADKHFYFKILKIYLSHHPKASEIIKSLRLDLVYDSHERYELLRSAIIHKPKFSHSTVKDYGFNLEDPVDQELLFKLLKYPLGLRAILGVTVTDYLNFKDPSIEGYVSWLFIAALSESDADLNSIKREDLYLIIGPELHNEHLSRFAAVLAFINKDSSKLHVFDDLLQKIPSLAKAIDKCRKEPSSDHDLLAAAFLVQLLAEKDQAIYGENLEKHNIVARLKKVNNFSVQLKLLVLMRPLLGVPNISKEKIDALL